MIRVGVADDHPLLRSGLRRVFEAQPNLKLVLGAGDGAELIEKLAAQPCDVLVLSPVPLITGVVGLLWPTLKLCSMPMASSELTEVPETSSARAMSDRAGPLSTSVSSGCAAV